MDRHILEKLAKWSKKENRQPLILTGARQVGKTWAMKEFGRLFYKKTAYISFDNNPAMREVFENSVRPKDLIPFLSAAAETEIDDETLIIFDEIQEIPKALVSLKYFYEEMPSLHIIVAGSTLGVSLNNGISFPVGKVEFMSLYPMSFNEFLDAIGEKQLRIAVATKQYNMLSGFHEKLIGLLKQYMLVGGMPEAVKEFVKNKSFVSVREIQNKILTSYEKDFSKYTTPEMAIKLSLLWKSIPAQLAKENKRFLYGAVRNGARARDFELAIQWLADSSLIHRVGRVSNPMLPLKSYEDFGIFKMFLHDIGLLCAISGVDSKIILDTSAIFREFKGALAEQFVCQELFAQNELPFYWSQENSQAEIDFLIQKENRVIPIEVKSGKNLQAKSLGVYIKKFSPQTALRISETSFCDNAQIIDLPLYAMSNFLE